MRKISLAMVAMLTVLLSVLGVEQAPAAMASDVTVSSSQFCNGLSGCITVTASFSNRSVTLQGSVYDDRNPGSTTATFNFNTLNGLYSTETRTASNETRSFTFTEEGPVGGIRSVDVYLTGGGVTYYAFTLPK